jgi:hypothetical protein
MNLLKINNSMETGNLDLSQYGIDVGLLISGLFGAILLTSKGSAMNLGRTFSSLVGGAASANYITPVIISISKLENVHFHHSIAFLLGFLGLKGVEFFSNKLLPSIENDIQKQKRTNPVKPKVRRGK